MTNTKRIISIALVLVLIVLAFTACGKKDKPATNPDTPSTTVNPSETDVSVPSIEDDTANAGETTTADAGKETADAGKGNNSSAAKPNKPSAAKPASKPSNSSSAKPNPSSAKPNKPSTTKPASSSTNKPSSAKPNPKPETTTKPSSSGTEKPATAQTAYFKASTGEKVKYYTYRSVNDSTCTGIKESNGRIVATYNKGASEEWLKCDNCGKYLCEGCQPVESPKCPKCGKTNCMTYTYDCTCYRCGKFVKGGTCHPCNGGLPGFEGPWERG